MPCTRPRSNPLPSLGGEGWRSGGLNSRLRMFLFVKKRSSWYLVALGLYTCVKMRNGDFEYQGLKRADLFEVTLAPMEINN